jgi:hypothetical protein
VNEVSDEISHCLALPLRSHVPDSVYRRKEEVVLVFNDVPSQLVTGCVRPPIVNHRPILLLDPFPSAQGGDRTVGVTRIVQQFVPVAH